MRQRSETANSVFRPVLVKVILAGTLSAGAVQLAHAADHAIEPQTASFNCSAVKPGDTVTLSGGTRGPLKITNCDGTVGNPIVFRNDPRAAGPTVIRRTSGGTGGFVLHCVDCVGVVFDGSVKWAGAPAGRTYGIKITMAAGGSPSAFLKLAGLSRFVTIRNVEIDGTWPGVGQNGIGISVNDHSKKSADHPGVWYEGIVIERNYVHNVQGEGLYIGPNWYTGGLPLRNIEIRENVIEDTGWDGIQLKSAIGGTNLIHHNVVRRVGRESDNGQLLGISVLDGTGHIYNNWVERSGDAGIQHFIGNLPRSYGDQLGEVYNNVVINSGQVGSTPGHGIASNGRDGLAPTVARIYNNTIVGATDFGIYVGSDATGGFVRDNIVADAGEKPIVVPATVSQENNRVGSASQMAFVDPSGLDFHLRPDSPARDAGSSNNFPKTDFDDTPRPQDGQVDQGAFEYDAAGSATRPTPPAGLAVE